MVISDNGTPKLSSTTRVVITVADVNDNGPEFQQKFYKAQIPATAKIDDKLYQVTDFYHFYFFFFSTSLVPPPLDVSYFITHLLSKTLYNASPHPPFNESPICWTLPAASQITNRLFLSIVVWVW